MTKAIRGTRGAEGKPGAKGERGAQLQRTAQLQLDKIQHNTTEACSALDVMQPLIKALVKQD